MLSRATLAYVLSLPILVTLASGVSGGHTLVLTMASDVPGFLQVFFDTGQGFSEGQSVFTPVYASAEPRDYRIPLPHGQVQARSN